MEFIAFLGAALGLLPLGKAVTRVDDVYGLALYGTSLIAGIWGFAIAPFWLQISLETLVCTWVILYLRTH